MSKGVFGAYGFDATAKQMFIPIREEAKKRGYGFEQIEPLDYELLVDNLEGYHDCDVLLINPASLDSRAEILLGSRAAQGTWPSFWLIEDVPYGAFREGALALAHLAEGVIAATDYSAVEARKLGKYKAVEFLGLPQHWKTIYQSMMSFKDARDEWRRGARYKWVGGHSVPFRSDDFLLVVPGPKEYGAANRLLAFALRAERIIGERFVLAFAPHPGELAEAERIGKEKMFYDVILTGRERMLERVPNLEINEERLLKLPCLYAIADLVLNNGGRSDDIPAAMARLPMMYWYNEATRQFLAESGLFFVRDLGGGRIRREKGKWFVAELGASWRFTTRTFTAGFQRMRDRGEAYRALHDAQERYFPVPKVWNTAATLVDFLERVVA